MDWNRLAAHGAGQPFEPVLYSTRVGFVIGIVAMVLAEILLSPVELAASWMSGRSGSAGAVSGSAFFLAITFPFVARGTYNFLSQRGETRTVAYFAAGGAIYLVLSLPMGGAGSLAWLPTILGGAVATAAYRGYNLERSGNV